MTIEYHWDHSNLQDYLLYDFWQPYRAWGVLAGYEYGFRADDDCNLIESTSDFYVIDSTLVDDGVEFEDFFSEKDIKLRKMRNDFKRLRDIAYSGGVWANSSTRTPEFFIDWALSKRFRPDWLDWAIGKGLYTPKELRNLPAITQNIPAAPDYSTSWLKIQQATIAQFFSPRRNPDAKKEEVVDWIKTQALEAGLPDSNNIATTIFTIIKPENHDPKKKRVDPQ